MPTRLTKQYWDTNFINKVNSGRSPSNVSGLSGQFPLGTNLENTCYVLKYEPPTVRGVSAESDAIFVTEPEPESRYRLTRRATYQGVAVLYSMFQRNPSMKSLFYTPRVATQEFIDDVTFWKSQQGVGDNVVVGRQIQLFAPGYISGAVLINTALNDALDTLGPATEKRRASLTSLVDIGISVIHFPNGGGGVATLGSTSVIGGEISGGAGGSTTFNTFFPPPDGTTNTSADLFCMGLTPYFDYESLTSAELSAVNSQAPIVAQGNSAHPTDYVAIGTVVGLSYDT